MVRTTKVTALVIIPVLAAAFVILFFFPGRTSELWAWTMRPDMTPITMGAGYLGGAWFFTRVASSADPLQVVGGLAAASAFTFLLGLATVLHWDRFNHDHVSFWAWLFLYVASPVLLPILAVTCGRAGGRAPDPAGGAEIPRWAQTFLGLVGAASVVGALAAFASPRLAVDTWPWPLTPLTARALSAFVAFTGLFLLIPLVDRRWVDVRFGIEAVTIGLVMTGLGALRVRGDFTGPTASVAGFAAALVVLVVVLVVLQLRLSRTAAG